MVTHGYICDAVYLSHVLLSVPMCACFLCRDGLLVHAWNFLVVPALSMAHICNCVLCCGIGCSETTACVNRLVQHTAYVFHRTAPA